ncbi:hypothetical protein B0H17DRAFT_1193339 [Mycena rosella]|uniref:Uncharacterized protein n=1 Tax=Mycena rosella TaxID=1033263 RepID=A0AAD7M7U6_MYCRO|nr:hypothetical protein B0H17DRAFT_1193339 [Mycena rosella]
MHTFRDDLFPPSAVYEMLARVRYPYLRSLELWYQIDAPNELAADECLLASLPRSFPLLHYLTIHRFVWQEHSLQTHWDPVPIFWRLLPEFKHLQTFSLDPDVPERAGLPPMLHTNAEFFELLARLKGMAEEIVSGTPWRREVLMYRPLEYASTWERWTVVAVPEEQLCLRPPPPDASDDAEGESLDDP